MILPYDYTELVSGNQTTCPNNFDTYIKIPNKYDPDLKISISFWVYGDARILI